MKNFFFIAIIFSLCLLVIFYPSNKELEYVYENDMIAAQVKMFDSFLRSHEKKIFNEIVLVTTREFGADSNITAFTQNFVSWQHPNNYRDWLKNYSSCLQNYEHPNANNI